MTAFYWRLRVRSTPPDGMKEWKTVGVVADNLDDAKKLAHTGWPEGVNPVVLSTTCHGQVDAIDWDAVEKPKPADAAEDSEAVT